MRALLCLPQLVLRAARDDLALILEVMTDQLEQRERLRHAVDERDRVVTERRLERCELEDLVERDLWHRFALELHVDAHPFLVGMVLKGVVRHRHLGQGPGLDEVGDLLDHTAFAGLTDAVRELRDDDRALAAAELLDVGAAAHVDAAATGAIRITDAAATDDRAAGRKVRALDVLREPLDVDRRVLDHRDDRVDDLAEIVRRNVRRHADSDAGRAVDQQVRESRGRTVG